MAIAICDDVSIHFGNGIFRYPVLGSVCVGDETQREVRGSGELFALYTSPSPPLLPSPLPIQVNTLNIDTLNIYWNCR